MRSKLLDRLRRPENTFNRNISWLKSVVSGSVYRAANAQNLSVLDTIKSQVDVMRALATDAQISAALSYYATDATTKNSSGQIIWAVPIDSDSANVADIVNDLFKRWKINNYAREHILELATYGNLYLPTTDLYRTAASKTKTGIALDNNTILDEEYDIIPSSQLLPEDVLHIWQYGEPVGYIYRPDDGSKSTTIYPEDSIVHFSLGGLIGKYKIDLPTMGSDLGDIEYDVQFAEPLLSRAVQPTQTLSLLEDAMLLSSLLRTIKFINVDCSGAEEEEIIPILTDIKNTVEQQISLNTATGDMQSFVNPQSPNNLIYLPKVNGADPISITDLNMADTNETESKLLEHYQNKKLSVLGVPKESLNFSSAEGLGGAGNVMSQRSAIYANSLDRLETAYIEGWTSALNAYFIRKNMSGFCNKYILKMNPIVTNLSTINFDKRDAALSQATTLVDLLKSLGVEDRSSYTDALTEVLSEVLPQTGNDVPSWKFSVESAQASEGGELDEF